MGRPVRLLYMEAKTRAGVRGIGWRFTFETWWQVWQASGKWDQRGRGGDAYCMARKRDRGPYSPKNVMIITNRENVAAAWRTRAPTAARKAAIGNANRGRRPAVADHPNRIAAMQAPAYRRKQSRRMKKIWKARKASRV